MDREDELIARIKARIADPLRVRDAAAYVRPLRPLPAPATHAEVDAAEAALGFPLPALLRRLYTEVANGRWGPDSGLQPVLEAGGAPDGNDLASFHQQCTAPERDLENPAVQWPRGLVTLVHSHDLVVCDFLREPYPVSRLDEETWDLERPLVESLVPVAGSLLEWLEGWVESAAGIQGR